MNPVDQVIADLWQRLLPSDRRALAVIGHCYTLERRIAKGEFVAWSELATDDRVALIRAMSGIGELAIECAATLEHVRRFASEVTL